jgi:outer membrane protein OmpA-like peptidoglycan-associated protein
MLDAQPDDMANQLEQLRQLPIARGVDVVLRGIGDTRQPQQALTEAEARNLLAIWAAILSRAGARVTVDPTPRRGDAPANAPPVTVVPVHPVLVVIDPPNATRTQTGDPPPRAADPLPAAAFFRPDTAQLLDEAAAAKAVRPIADAALKSGTLVELTGTTARVGDAAGQRMLSQARAQRLADLLHRLGVPANRIKADGVGSYWPGYHIDHDAAGHLIPAAATLNRTVQVRFVRIAGKGVRHD